MSEFKKKKTFSKEHKKNLSENHAGYWLGKIHSEETKIKMSKAKEGKNHPF